jgi:archaellum component FlaC
MNDEERLKATWKREILDPVELLNGGLDMLDKRQEAFANELLSVHEQLANLARIVCHLDEKILKLEAEITRLKTRLDAIEAPRAVP